jgi:hypothetical protein
MKVDPEAPPPPPPPIDDRPKPPPVVVEHPASGGPSGLRITGAIALGVGAVGLGIGIVGGAVALGAKGDLDRLCPTKANCPKGTLDSANTAAAVSTVGFIVGGVGIAAGVIFLLLPASKSDAPKAARWIRPYAGFGEAGVVGAF